MVAEPHPSARPDYRRNPFAPSERPENIEEFRMQEFQNSEYERVLVRYQALLRYHL
jgi:hypothetical protein